MSARGVLWRVVLPGCSVRRLCARRFVVALKVEDCYPQAKRWWVRLHENGGKLNEMPCHHNLEAYLDAYIEAAGRANDRKGPLFRSARGKTGHLTDEAMSRIDAWRMVPRRAADAEMETAIGCHTFRATGTTDYLKNDDRIEIAQAWPGTRMRKRPVFTTVETTRSALLK